MQRRFAFLAALTAAALTGCNSGGEDKIEQRTPMPATLAGTYSGALPCSNCAAIEATLWLRPDGRFFLRQHLKDDASATSAPQGASTTHALGRWSWDEVAAQVVLRGAGPERRLRVTAADRLELQVASPLPHVLARDAGAAAFGDRVTFDGESTVSDKGATFKECLTGLTFAVADAGAYRELRRQHRRMNARGKIALTTVEGHLVNESTPNEQLVVDKFIMLKPGRGC